MDLVLPARAGPGLTTGWGRVLALAFGLPVATAFALLCQWPARATGTAQVAVNTLVTISFVAAAIMLAGRPARRAVAVPLAGAGLCWALTWAGIWEAGPFPAASSEAETFFWVLLVWACLRYPDGRVTDRFDRRFLAALVLVLPVQGGLLVVLSKASWNGFHPTVWWPGALANRTAFDALTTFAGVAAFGLSLTFVWVIVRRLARLPPLERQVVAPIGVALGVSGVCAGVTTIFKMNLTGRSISPVFLPMAAALLAVPAAFAVAALRARLARAGVATILVAMASPPTVESVQAAVAEALGDPTAKVAFRLLDEDTFVDASGRAIVPPQPGGDRLVAAIRARDGERIALLEADGALRGHRDLVEGVVATAALALENARLQAALRARLANVRASRTRIVEAGLAERRRLERDLHDGTQQRLLAVVARIGLARVQAGEDSAPAIDAVLDELRDTLRELRALARGIYPPVLTDAGLAEALDAAMETFPIPVTVSVAPDRFDPATETAAYLTVIDILTHATRAGGATRATVRSRRDLDDLWLSVEHDGLVAVSVTADPGLSAVDDRLRALDGELRLGPATSLRARIPCG